MSGSTSKQQQEYGVLILSDLRFTDDRYCERPNTCKFKNDNLKFSTIFHNNLRDQISNNNIDLRYLLVLGDITDSALKTEFDKAKGFLESLIHTYEIPRENVLIIPGNHDIARSDQRKYLQEKNISKNNAHLYQRIKYPTFTEFYNDFFNSCQLEFKPDNALIREMVAPELETVFVGINTLYKEAFSDDLHYGAINPNIDQELMNIHKKYPGKCIIACMHHLIQNGNKYENLKQKCINNWYDVLPAFDREEITVFFTAGNAQPAQGETLATGKQRDYLVCGSISPSPSSFTPESSAYVLLKYDKTEKKSSMKILPYKYEYDKSEPYWQLQSVNPNTLREIIINTLTGVSALNDTFSNEEKDGVSKKQGMPVTESHQRDNDKLFYEAAENYILDVIKANDLYMLGDFRWDPKGNSISYIMTDYFFDNYVCLERVKEFYKKLLDDKCKCLPDLIIGYEMNGNIIGPLLAIDKGCDYTYLPADNRKHTEKEKRLPIKTECTYSTIVVVLDLVYTKNIIRYVTKKIKEVYSSVKHLYFLSLVEGVRKRGNGITEAGVEAYIEPVKAANVDNDKNDDINTGVKEDTNANGTNNKDTFGKEDAEADEKSRLATIEEDGTNKNVESGTAVKKLSCIEELREELGVEDLYAYSICQIPMIASSFNGNNCKLFRKQIIPIYQLFSKND